MTKAAFRTHLPSGAAPVNSLQGSCSGDWFGVCQLFISRFGEEKLALSIQCLAFLHLSGGADSTTLLYLFSGVLVLACVHSRQVCQCSWVPVLPYTHISPASASQTAVGGFAETPVG